MTCENGHPECDMELDIIFTDYHDPSDPHGHGQYETQAWVCPECDNVEMCEEVV